MMYNVYQPAIGMRRLEQLLTLVALAVDLCPLTKDTKCLLGPSTETDFFDDRGCHDFFAGEHAPGYGIGAALAHVAVVGTIGSLQGPRGRCFAL
ncbi:hypothetical protein O1611_g8122 [Lasiodiplodia mahajangana]|uniref:Uncharacterized protein n=1 Tax=Lasiodiplodia mahajangana TaxID=1108764 RepID=A0ACC2JE78_9PEZI|nr:hypothetical protein O1611_g8122 [Lasiodiplodia mahajangana]